MKASLARSDAPPEAHRGCAGAAIRARRPRCPAHRRSSPRRRAVNTMPRRGAASWRCAALLACVALAAARGAAGSSAAGPQDLVAPADGTRRDAQVGPPARHLLGPFAEHAAALQAQAAGAASATVAALQARRKALEAAAAARQGVRGPRRALMQTIQSDTVLIALIILILDFFLGFYTGYIKGFFT